MKKPLLDKIRLDTYCLLYISTSQGESVSVVQQLHSLHMLTCEADSCLIHRPLPTGLVPPYSDPD